MAIILPYIELFTGIFLILGVYKKGSSAIIAISLLIFIIALASAYARGLNIDCGCGFSSLVEEKALKNELLLRIIEDIFMLIGIAIVFIFSDRKDAEPEKIKEEQIIQGET